MQVVAERVAFDASGPRHHGRRSARCAYDRHVFHLLFGQHAPPPPHTADQGQPHTNHTDDEVSHQPGEPERDAECQDHRPHGGRWQRDAVGFRGFRHDLSNASTARSSGRYIREASNTRRAEPIERVLACARPVPSNPSPSAHAVTKYVMPLIPITVGSRLTATRLSVDDTIWRSASV